MNEVIAQVSPFANVIAIASAIAIMIVIAWNAIKLMLVIPWKHGMKWQTVAIVLVSFAPLMLLGVFPSVMGYWATLAFSAVISTIWIMKLTLIWKQVGISSIQRLLVVAGQPLAWLPLAAFAIRKRIMNRAPEKQPVAA